MRNLQAGDIVNFYYLRDPSTTPPIQGALIGTGLLVSRITGEKEAGHRRNRPYLDDVWEIWRMKTKGLASHCGFSGGIDVNWIHPHDLVKSAAPLMVAPGHSFVPDWGEC